MEEAAWSEMGGWQAEEDLRFEQQFIPSFPSRLRETKLWKQRARARSPVGQQGQLGEAHAGSDSPYAGADTHESSQHSTKQQQHSHPPSFPSRIRKTKLWQQRARPASDAERNSRDVSPHAAAAHADTHDSSQQFVPQQSSSPSRICSTRLWKQRAKAGSPSKDEQAQGLTEEQQQHEAMKRIRCSLQSLHSNALPLPTPQHDKNWDPDPEVS